MKRTRGNTLPRTSVTSEMRVYGRGRKAALSAEPKIVTDAANQYSWNESRKTSARLKTLASPAGSLLAETCKVHLTLTLPGFCFLLFNLAFLIPS